MQKRYLITVLVVVLMLGSLTWTTLSRAQDEEEGTSSILPNLGARAAKVLETQMTEKATKRIPAVLRKESRCIVAFPGVIKTGFIVAFKGGHGVGSCRDTGTGAWGTPVLFNIVAGSVGLQAGVQSATVIMLVTNQVGVEALLKGKVSFGPGMSLVAGPVGGTVDMKTQQPFLSYVRTKGLFAGLDLEAATLSFAKSATEKVYGTKVGAQEILSSQREIPDSLKIFYETLNKFTS